MKYFIFSILVLGNIAVRAQQSSCTYNHKYLDLYENRVFVENDSFFMTASKDDFRDAEMVRISGLNVSKRTYVYKTCLFENVRYLILDGVEKLPKNIDKLCHIQGIFVLYSPNINFRKLYKSLIKCKELRFLKVTNCNIKKLPLNIRELNSLEAIDLSDNHIINIDNIASLVNLRELILDNNEIYELPDSFRNLNEIECIDLSYNSFNHVPEVLGELSNITTFNFGGNKLKNFDFEEIITKLNELKFLELHDCNLCRFPSKLGALPNLEIFSICNNPIEVWDGLECGFPQLKQIYVPEDSFNKVDSIKNIEEKRFHFSITKLKE